MNSQSTPRFGEAAKVFGEIGLLSFGGPAAQISLMHRKLVDENSWLTEKQFLGALNFCMLLPGPEAMQLATYSGWRLHGVKGGLIAGLLFVLPGAAIVLLLAMLYGLFGEMPLVSTLFVGIKAAVLIIVVEALVKVSKRALNGSSHWVIAAAAFVGIFFLKIPFPVIILMASIYGYLQRGESSSAAALQPIVLVSPFKTLKIGITGLVVWFAPLLILAWATDLPVLMDIGVFFSKLAVVTFGGAYAVLAYMGQDVVEHYNWLTAGEMMDGLGLAETTPGPLILVTEFVGFLAAYRADGMVVGILGAAVTLWVTFVPCFLWIFMGAPYIEWISAQPRLHSAMSAVTAAVVGVILNLSIWFAMHVVFTDVQYDMFGPITLPQLSISTIDWRVPPLSLLCAVLLLKSHWNITGVLVLSALLGWMLTALT